MFDESNDQYYMEQALRLAALAALQEEVPVGAVLVCQNKIIATGANRCITANDPTAHAEIVALREGAKQLNNYRLLDTTLYVSLEPCIMCVGAMVHARIKRLVFGAYDPKTGAVSSVANMLDLPYLNHRITHQGGLLSDQSSHLLRHFFSSRR